MRSDAGFRETNGINKESKKESTEKRFLFKKKSRKNKQMVV